MINQNFYETKDMSKTVTIKNKSKVMLAGVKPGKTVKVPCDEHGTPLQKYWRNRIRDASIDDCVEVVKPKTAKKKETK